MLDTFGNVTATSSFDGSKYITSNTSYTANGNYLASKTNADGETTAYAFNNLNGVLSSITNGNGNTTSYTYDGYNLLTSVNSINQNTNLTSGVGFAYNDDRLSSITHNGFTYSFVYDMWGQLICVKVNSTELVSYNYGTGKYRERLTSITYHNLGSGDEYTADYTYNSDGNISKITAGGEIFRYSYDAFGNIDSVSAEGVRIVKYLDGKMNICDDGNNVIYSLYTDDEGNAVETIGAVSYTTQSLESAYSQSDATTQQSSVVSTSNGKTVTSSVTQDFFGRTVSAEAQTGNATVSAAFVYPTFDTDKTSERVSQLTNSVVVNENTVQAMSYSYTYDDNGNITAEYGNGNVLRYGYVYDILDQLVRVNDNVGNKTFVYTYDTAGNILTKAEYPYTTGDLGTATNTVNYTYDTAWKDKLLSYGSNQITYDNIGNPLTIGNKSFTWSGRQLETFTQGNKTVEFSYDESGLRHRKTVKENGVITEQYDYIWSNGCLVSQTYTANNTSNTAKFIYDNIGTLQGFILNDSAVYLYTRDLQGDIASIVNESGNTILNYSYDAWGDISFSATSMGYMALAYTLSFVSPFTYRGYCYDYDIELYYLQSRYYDSKICRFINADSTDYLGTTGTTLSYNLFAYCENNPVNYVDATGMWGKSVHLSDTKTWAKKAWFNDAESSVIAEADNDMDDIFSTHAFWPSKQYIHFNVNIGMQIIASAVSETEAERAFTNDITENPVRCDDKQNIKIESSINCSLSKNDKKKFYTISFAGYFSTIAGSFYNALFFKKTKNLPLPK